MTVRSVTVYVLGDGTGLTRVLNKASVDLDRFAANAEKSGGRIGGILGSTVTKGVVAGGVALAAGLGLAAAAAVPFEAAMHNVATISTDVQKNFEGTSQAVLNLSRTVPQSATTLAKGLYEIVSSNFAGADAFHVLEVSAKAASAGLTDTDTSARAITGALNAYGLSAASAGDVSDILFQTVNKGVVTFGDLAQNLGDFVGTAAAAKVPLQDVASAYAAITLAGVPAAEAATSVNQLLTKLIKPTVDLAAVYKTLGYESGAAALQQKGLQGVIKDIGRVTGGSADQLVRMFNDVRAARGVLALLSADGKNYQAAVNGIADASARGGATQRAFNEQMKSTQAQLQLFVNSAEAVGISIGLKVLPAIGAFLQAARQAGADALPFLEAALHRVGPLFQQLWAVLGNLATIIKDLATAAGPLAGALAQIAAAAVVGPLMLFLNVLTSLTGFLADHKVVVEALAAVYVASLIPGIVAAGVQMLLTAADAVYFGLSMDSVRAAALGADIALTKVKLSASLVTGVMTAGVAAALVGLANGFQNMNTAAADSKKQMDDIKATFDETDTTKSQQQIHTLVQAYDQGKRVAKEYAGALGETKVILGSMFGDGQVEKVLQQGKDAGDTLDELGRKSGNTGKNLDEVARVTGVTAAALQQLAKQQNIDLSGTFDSSADARKRLIEYTRDLAHTQDVATASFVAGFGQDVEAAKKAEDAVQKFADTVQKAFQKDTDVLGSFDPTGDAARITKAQAAVDKARKGGTASGVSTLRDEQRIARDRQAVRDAEDRAAANSSKSALSHLSSQQSVARAQRKLADDQALIAAKGTAGAGGSSSAAGNAAAKLAQAQADAANNTLKSQYAKAIDLGKSFVRDINAALQRGLDPSIIGKLLEEGPAKAEPALQAILRDHSGNMIKMVNASEAAIGQMSEYVAEEARITARAINAPSDEYTRNLKTAMGIAAQEAATGGKATADALARSLRTSAANVRSVAQMFGITIAQDVQAAVDKHGPIQVLANGQIRLQYAPSGGKNPSQDTQDLFQRLAGTTPWWKKRAEGGPLDGAPGRDVIPFMGTRGEWVQPKAAVDFYGTGLMEAIRTRTLPRFWDGGMVGGPAGSTVLNVAGPRVLAVPVPVQTASSTDNSTNYNIGTVTVRDTRELAAQYRGRSYSPTRGVR